MRARRLSAVVLSATLAMGMAACGEDDTPTTTAAGGQTGATTPATTPATAPATTAAPKPTVKTASTSLGTVLTDGDGKTLYTWDRDTGPASTCVGNCAATWPPLVLSSGTASPIAGAGVSLLTSAPRPDDAAKLQVNWDNKPLYYYAADQAPGDVKGDGVGGTWHVVKTAY